MSTAVAQQIEFKELKMQLDRTTSEQSERQNRTTTTDERVEKRLF
jgi:hypothetical protein